MHYVDEGPRDGRPVVLLHGNPTWGFLYRNFIPPLVDAGHRVVVPDYLGFGRSEKPPKRQLYAVDQHVRRLDRLLESLDLQDATVVPQDWGGPIGLSWAVAHPARVRSLFILNTAAHVPPGKVGIPLSLRVFRAPGIGELLVQGLAMFHRAFLFRVGVVHRDRMTTEIKRAYLAPHPTWRSRKAVLAFPREIPSGPTGPLIEFARKLEAGLRSDLGDRPVHIVWGMRDPAFSSEWIEQLWLKTFPHATVTRLHDSGHYLQEDAHERIVPELLEFLARN
jgi:cis-3-alkyl-4-acyloxetan-2-one decarboxylase